MLAGDNYNSNTNLCDTICLCLQINVLDISVEPTELQELLEETVMVWPQEGQPCSVKGCPATDHVFTRIGFYRAYFLKFHKAKVPVYSVAMPWSQVHYPFLQIASFEGACSGKTFGDILLCTPNHCGQPTFCESSRHFGCSSESFDRASAATSFSSPGPVTRGTNINFIITDCSDFLCK